MKKITLYKTGQNFVPIEICRNLPYNIQARHIELNGVSMDSK